MTNLKSTLRSSLKVMATKSGRIKRLFKYLDAQLGLAQHSIAQAVPQIIQPRARKITVAITAHCNLRCVGCRYGRDFMRGAQLSLPMVRDLLDDAKAAGIETVRLYGGEPLLHPKLDAMVRHAVDLGMSTYVTTNGMLLHQKIGLLYKAGLRNITIGFYGTAAKYDAYVQRDRSYRRLEENIAAVRERYGSSISMQLNYLLMRPSCSIKALHNAWFFAERYDLEFTTDLIHYSLPYFTEGVNGELQFRKEDNRVILEWVAELVRLKIRLP